MFQRSVTRYFVIFLLSLTATLSLLLGRFSSVAHSADPVQLVEQGIAQYRADNFKGAIATWQTALTAYSNDPVNRTIVLENIARAYQQLNQSSEAIKIWSQLISIYRQDRNVSKLSKALIEQAQLFSSIGQPKQALVLLCNPNSEAQCTSGSAVQLANQSQDQAIIAAALGSLGDAYRLSGNNDQAIKQLNQALELAQDNPSYQILALNGLANAYLGRSKLSLRRAESAKTRTQEQSAVGEAARLEQNAQNDKNQAIQKLNASMKLAQAQGDRQAQLRSLLSLLSIYDPNEPAFVSILQTAIALLNDLPDSRVKLYSMIDLARFPQAQNREELLQGAIALAEKLEDDRAESFAYGELGKLYENTNREKALSFTQKAILLADQKQRAKDSLYLWEWQSGRLLAADSSKLQDAIAAYERAVQTLEEIRSDILSANVDLQFDFRKSVEPVYRELIALRLKSATQPRTKQQAIPQTQRSKEDITLVLTAMDSLRLAELHNYFGNECVLAAINRLPDNITTEENKSAAIQNILSSSTQDQKTAILNHILLPDQLILVLNLPNNEQHTVSINVTRKEIEEKIVKFRQLLERYYDPTDFDLTLSQDLYEKLIQPVQSFLPDGVDTLVFVQDGLLRGIPMAALHDGKQYLVEKYAIATTPSLSLIDLAPFDRSGLRALALGVTKAVTLNETQQNYRVLKYAEQELQDILTALPGSKRFELLKSDLKTRLQEQPYPIIHITTHGQFGADPKDTFLVTSDGKRLTIEDFDKLLRDRTNPNDPIELLMLTACQTGTGDDRSALGLAGVAIQAGVKSALASLWFINDETTANWTREFYKNLKRSDLSKAQAVQKAQISLIRESVHPGFWSAFILVGNWR
ncbi:CHAT domain-containing protein [Leptolyngbya boryana FACHB-1624]